MTLFEFYNMSLSGPAPHRSVEAWDAIKHLGTALAEQSSLYAKIRDLESSVELLEVELEMYKESDEGKLQ